ncbi:uncharacterized protein LOC135072982 [Ostrinia nubilalis]|uniref:uncharacterized protein LOC135072982 n=1 Tax=Ostrinia nubilalis TaxID=29057 RepID=UPI00308248C3
MGKRKRSNSRIRRKIRRLEKRLRRSSSTEYEENYRDKQTPPRDSQSVLIDSSRSESSPEPSSVRSEVIVTNISEKPTSNDPLAGTSSETVKIPEELPPEIIEALGDYQSKDETLGPAISEEISKRWGRIIVEGMTKEAKEAILQKILIPENFKLAKAPKLNQEISAVLSDTVRNRDKLLEKAQNYLGLGIAGLTNLATDIISTDLDKVSILKKLSEVSQILLDLHYEDTKTRRKLVTTSLDKKFYGMVADVKRDEFLFGTALGDKIKAAKAAERSGFQIKRVDNHPRPTNGPQGNWRGPPRNQAPAKAPRQGGPKNRYQPYQPHQSQTSRRQPTSARAAPAAKANSRTRRT